MATTTKSPTYLLVQEKVGRDTVDWLRVQRDAEKSWRLISLELLRDHDLNVTEVTLRSWWDKAHPKEPEPATADG